ncbi:helix-turn-helix domain-containing protein [Actinomadura macra]|uniref:helix-turn-helix domain-containing protein n=1 Tax=Actinomadura macra TaxID=46164 RepID=UPI0008300B03|nr:helix-turn-helix domain-containing protein [Actinomadura macra]
MADSTGYEPDPDILTTEELSAKIRIAPPTIRKAASRGDIPGMRIGKDWRFSYSAVVAAIASYYLVADDGTDDPPANPAALDFPHDIRQGVPQRDPTGRQQGRPTVKESRPMM